ncbi:MAG: hypothetical protein BMS9Abin21_245 [Thermodesulfovibrionia bacterium]|nr:MAG: hypothetical protein BMS9Abin21_245 [Thermodesulfovibrionia bacterium]
MRNATFDLIKKFFLKYFDRINKSKRLSAKTRIEINKIIHSGLLLVGKGQDAGLV